MTSLEILVFTIAVIFIGRGAHEEHSILYESDKPFLLMSRSTYEEAYMPYKLDDSLIERYFSR